MLIKMQMQRCIQSLDRYRIRDQPQKANFFWPFLHLRSSYGWILNSNDKNIKIQNKMDRSFDVVEGEEKGFPSMGVPT